MESTEDSDNSSSSRMGVVLFPSKVGVCFSSLQIWADTVTCFVQKNVVEVRLCQVWA